jgi:hypothetical protein
MRQQQTRQQTQTPLTFWKLHMRSCTNEASPVWEATDRLIGHKATTQPEQNKLKSAVLQPHQQTDTLTCPAATSTGSGWAVATSVGSN